jgi:dTDP-4-amino-4,6-dideoxygalactose transaminase
MMRDREYRVGPAGLATADTIMTHGIMLPCHPTMTREDCDYLYQTIQDFIDADGQVTVMRPLGK